MSEVATKPSRIGQGRRKRSDARACDPDTLKMLDVSDAVITLNITPGQRARVSVTNAGADVGSVAVEIEAGISNKYAGDRVRVVEQLTKRFLAELADVAKS